MGMPISGHALIRQKVTCVMYTCVYADDTYLQEGDVLRVIEPFVDEGWVVAEFGGRRGLAPCPYLSSIPGAAVSRILAAHRIRLCVTFRRGRSSHAPSQSLRVLFSPHLRLTNVNMSDNRKACTPWCSLRTYLKIHDRKSFDESVSGLWSNSEPHSYLATAHAPAVLQSCGSFLPESPLCALFRIPSHKTGFIRLGCDAFFW
jgi:hypothetical protein